MKYCLLGRNSSMAIVCISDYFWRILPGRSLQANYHVNDISTWDCITRHINPVHNSMYCFRDIHVIALQELRLIFDNYFSFLFMCFMFQSILPLLIAIITLTFIELSNCKVLNCVFSSNNVLCPQIGYHHPS